MLMTSGIIQALSNLFDFSLKTEQVLISYRSPVKISSYVKKVFYTFLQKVDVVCC